MVQPVAPSAPSGPVSSSGMNNLTASNVTGRMSMSHQEVSSPPPKVVIKRSDMSDDMLREAVELAVGALSRFELERDMANYLKRQFDERFQPTWHCIVGRHFGSFVTHEDHAFVYFYIDKLAVLLFKSGNIMPS